MTTRRTQNAMLRALGFTHMPKFGCRSWKLKTQNQLLIIECPNGQTDQWSTRLGDGWNFGDPEPMTFADTAALAVAIRLTQM